jgi:glycosyltransferase involved in cell wall biosynthesis
MHNNEKPLVSIVTITYNHELYIEDTINGVLIQDFDFDIEFIIANDASSDNSHQIILDAISKSKGKTNINFRYYNHTENKGLTPNFIWALKQARGEYIATVDGDDYWTDPFKLKKQVAYMEAHPECVLTYHLSKELYNGEYNLIERTKQRLLTFVFRNIITEYPTEFYKTPNNDTFLKFFLKMYGEFKFLEDIEPAICRVHEGGVMSTLSEINRLPRSLETHKQIYNFAKNTKYEKETYRQFLFYKLKLSLFEAKHPLFLIFITLNFIFKYGYPKLALSVLFIYRIRQRPL